MWPFDENNRGTYQQYAQGYDTGNYGGIDPNQASGYIQQFLQGAPADMQQRVYQQHFEQMPYEQRAFIAQQVPQYGMDPNNPFSMSQGMFRLGQEQPGMVQRLFSHPMLLGGSVALAGLIAKHMLDHHERQREREPQYVNNQGYQDSYQNQGYGEERELRRELNEERREDKELRRELRDEEREENREERHHRREEW